MRSDKDLDKVTILLPSQEQAEEYSRERVAAIKDAMEQRPIMVRNKDIPLLANIFCIMQDITSLEQRRDWQKCRMLNITQHLTGMPGGNGLPKGLEDAFAILAEIDAEHEAKCREYARKLKKAQKILNSIESQTMRTFVVMRYVMSVPDAKIRQDLNMTRRGFDRACRAVEDAPDMASVKWHERYIVVQQ